MRAPRTVARGLLIGVLVLLTGCAQSPSPPAAPRKPPLEYLGEWGTRGDGPGQLKTPVSLAVDFAGNVYVADVGNGYVHKFSPHGRALLSFQDPALVTPGGIAVDRGGAIYVADGARRRVVIFYPDGTRLGVTQAAGPPSRELPMRVGVDDEGNVYVADAGRHHVQKFNPRRRLVKTWGKRSARDEVKSPADIAIGPDGFLYLTDGESHRVLKFTRDGEFVFDFALPEPTPERAVLAGVTLSERHVFAADPVTHAVHVWSLGGQFELTDALGSRLQVEESTPCDVAVSPRKELLVLDNVGARVLRFRINF